LYFLEVFETLSLSLLTELLLNNALSQIVFSTNTGVLHGITTGKCFVEMSTIDEETVQDVAEVGGGFLAFNFLSVLRDHSFFIPATTVNDLRLRRISIPVFIHYIFLTKLILEKEPVFPFLMLSAK